MLLSRTHDRDIFESRVSRGPDESGTGYARDPGVTVTRLTLRGSNLDFERFPTAPVLVKTLDTSAANTIRSNPLKVQSDLIQDVMVRVRMLVPGFRHTEVYPGSI